MAPAQNWIAYIGTYTTGVSKGIYVSRFDSDTGKLTQPMICNVFKKIKADHS